MLDLGTVTSSFLAQCEESQGTALVRAGRQRRVAQVTSYHGTAMRPLRGDTHSGFCLQVSTDNAFPSFIKTIL